MSSVFSVLFLFPFVSLSISNITGPHIRSYFNEFNILENMTTSIRSVMEWTALPNNYMSSKILTTGSSEKVYNFNVSLLKAKTDTIGNETLPYNVTTTDSSTLLTYYFPNPFTYNVILVQITYLLDKPLCHIQPAGTSGGEKVLLGMDLYHWIPDWNPQIVDNNTYSLFVPSPISKSDIIGVNAINYSISNSTPFLIQGQIPENSSLSSFTPCFIWSYSSVPPSLWPNLDYSELPTCSYNNCYPYAKKLIVWPLPPAKALLACSLIFLVVCLCFCENPCGIKPRHYRFCWPKNMEDVYDINFSMGDIVKKGEESSRELGGGGGGGIDRKSIGSRPERPSSAEERPSSSVQGGSSSHPIERGSNGGGGGAVRKEGEVQVSSPTSTPVITNSPSPSPPPSLFPAVIPAVIPWYPRYLPRIYCFIFWFLCFVVIFLIFTQMYAKEQYSPKLPMVTGFLIIFIIAFIASFAPFILALYHNKK